MLKLILLSTCLLFVSGKVNCQNAKTVEAKTKADSSTVEVDDRIFTQVEYEAQFEGGRSAWISYLQSNLKPDIPVKRGAPVGTYQVIVKFIVSKDGSISDVQAETSHGYGMEKEVIRIIKKGPKWSPAMQNGHPVKAYRRQPVTFIVSNG